MSTRHGYARVSTNDQHPEAQSERLRAAGCALVWTDKGVSGTQARRPQWDKLLAALQPGDELVCVKLDRIGRSVGNLVEVVEELRTREVELVVLDQGIDTSTPSGKLLFHVIAAIAEFERDLIVERTLDGQLSVRRAGNLRRSLGGPPVLGFRESTGDDWEQEPTAAEWLREAAQRVLAGEPVEQVHAQLPVLHDAQGREVNVKMLRAALQRPASAGLLQLGEELVPASIGGPLDRSTWDRLQLLFGSRKRGRPVDSGRYWAGPVLRCSRCGNQLTGQPGYKERGYYACRNPHLALGVTKPCRGVSVLAEDVHALLHDAVVAWSETPAARAAAALSPETGSRRSELEERIAESQEWLADLAQKRQRRYITPERYAALEQEAVASIDSDTAELEQLEQLEQQPGVAAVIEWEAMTPAERLRAVSEAVRTPIKVQPGNGGGAARSAADRVELLPH